MKTIQTEVFTKAKMSMKEYGESMIQYEKRFSEVIQERMSLETREKNLMKFKSKSKKLNEERTKIVDIIKKIQQDYITGAKYETRIYENMLKSYSSRLAEIEEQLAVADIKKAFKGK